MSLALDPIIGVEYLRQQDYSQLPPAKAGSLQLLLYSGPAYDAGIYYKLVVAETRF